MLSINFSLFELFRFDAFIATITSLFICIFIVGTRKWHGSVTVDSTDGPQKFHTLPTPRVAGIAIIAGVFAGYAASSHDIAAAEKRFILSSILLAGMPAFFFGLLEDLTKKVSVKIRLFATMASGLVGWGITGVSLTSVDVWGVDWLLSFTFFSVIFTAFAVGGVANAINIIDGFNGLTAGTSIIMLVTFGFIARAVGDIPLAFTCLVIGGAVLGFFIVNWPYGKIFLGDGGAYFLGFSLAWIAILLPERNKSISPWASLLICAYPIIEVCFSFLRKSIRDGYHPSQPDGVHLHMLANKRWAKHIFNRFSPPIQNGLTSPFLWTYNAIPCISAYIFYKSTFFSMIALIFCIIIYLGIYTKLAHFRWIKIK